MEIFVTLLIPVLVGLGLLRLLALPVRLLLKLALHAGAGFLCLWLLNAIAPFTGISFPINLVTTLVAGIAGLPGVGLLAVLAVLP